MLEKLQDSTMEWPMGYFENPNFASGTFAIAQMLSELPNAFTLVGGEIRSAQSKIRTRTELVTCRLVEVLVLSI